VAFFLRRTVDAIRIADDVRDRSELVSHRLSSETVAVRGSSCETTLVNGSIAA
jgi:hypothetical protein